MSTTPLSDTRQFLLITITATVIAESITIGCRIVIGTADAFIAADPPLLLQMHHMFWSVPFLLCAAVLAIRGRGCFWPWVMAIALIASDLLHHFVVLPLWVGHTGWHWP